MKIAVIGYGGRGAIYANTFKYLGAEVTAVCDIDALKLKVAGKLYSLDDNMLFYSEDDFFKRGKLADVCVISTQDTLHMRHSIKAMEAGYDLLLEKPIAATEEECRQIHAHAERLNRTVFVCHVLRYAPFFASIKEELTGGEYGKLITLNMTENVGYWHFVHSYVRGSWNNAAKSSPMIVAKSCHDLDIINWLLEGQKCVGVSSYGSLMHFKKENAPDKSTDRCLTCPYIDSCEFSAVRIYKNLNHFPQGS